MPTEAKPYKETLNLPVTRFEMKANLTVREPQFQARWKEMDLYGLIRQARSGSEKGRRVLHDGPPYANGEIHMGHLLNKVLKDVVVRYLTMRGYDSPYVPGWDCHGLPIEHKVVKDLGAKAAGMEPAEIRRLCYTEAMHWVNVQRDQFRRLAVSGDWDHPYLTLDREYEAGILDVLAELVDRGFVFRQLKPIHWDIHDRTALAEAELEYQEHTSTSVYVNFPMLAGVPPTWGDGPWHAMIWTTTPWTLPANVAIAAHPDVEYAGIRYVDPESGATVQTILAAELVGKVMALRNVTSFTEVGRVKGRELEGSRYRHVFVDREGPIVLADYVTVEDGTGLVHTAPGHGAEDYRTGQKYGLPTLSPVDESGRFTSEAPEWIAGQNVFKANGPIVERLKESGALFHTFSFRHQYPHGWRSKKPVIFRATAQWFVGVDHNDLRGKALEAIRGVKWMPGWGQARIEAMVSGRPDWCISRQRSWGVPIPVLYDEADGYAHLTAESVRFHRDLFREHGADAWYTRDVAELVPPDLDTAEHPVERLRKGTDILDVWFESGSSHRSVVREPRYDIGPYPAFLYLEGSDQHRGWFQSSLLTAVGTTDRAPFETVLTHGFIVDEKGEKMAKSGGNAISALKATEQYGADVLRLYVASMDYADDVRMSERGIKEASEAYRKIRNTFRFLLGNLEDYRDFDPESVDPATLHEIDRWALGQLNKVIAEVTAAYDRFEFYRAYQRIYQFCAVDLSSFYLDVLKDRLYAELPIGPDRRAAQFVLARLHTVLARLLAPILPHTAEELWDFVPESGNKPWSVHLAPWPEEDPPWDTEGIDRKWTFLRRLRDQVLMDLESLRQQKRIGSSQEASISLLAGSPQQLSMLVENRELITSLLMVSEVTVKEGAPHRTDLDWGLPTISSSESSYSKCERCWNRRPTVGQAVAHPTLCDRCERVMAEIRRSWSIGDRC
jgi:isoleucyl-tRNA synthetase